jgi:hypothetical protein
MTRSYMGYVSSQTTDTVAILDYGVASGGTLTTPSDGGFTWQLLSFTGDGTLTVSETGLFDFFVLSGGGGLGRASSGVSGGAGAGGGILTGTIYLTAGTYTVTVGAGGAANSNGGNIGGWSGIGSRLVMVGGGGGRKNQGGETTMSIWGANGGGGCQGDSGSPYVVQSGATSAINGFSGGQGYNNSNYAAGGGGGGAGGAGANYTQTGGQETMKGGAGGVGLSYSWTGSSVGYGGGGAGGHSTTQAVTAGTDGGGSGTNQTTTNTSGAANRGGGAGGFARMNQDPPFTATAGGSGLVMVRFR